MFQDNGVILQELNGAGVPGDCRTRCNFKRPRLDTSYEWTRVMESIQKLS